MANTPPRRSAGKRVVMMGNPCGARIAAPNPWAPRARMSCVGSWARPLKAEAMVNTTMPATNMLRGSKMSPSRPEVISRTAYIRL